MIRAALALSLLLLPLQAAAAEDSPFAIRVGPSSSDVRPLPISADAARALFGDLSKERAEQVERASEALYAYLSTPEKGWKGPPLNIARITCAPAQGGKYDLCDTTFTPPDPAVLDKELDGAVAYDPYALGSKDGRDYAVQLIHCRSATDEDGPWIAVAFAFSGSKLSGIVINPQPWIRVLEASPAPVPAHG